MNTCIIIFFILYLISSSVNLKENISRVYSDEVKIVTVSLWTICKFIMIYAIFFYHWQ